MYKRLPHGPHRLARNEVIQHQRARIHGAMVEAVAHDGYEGTSVKQVIGLAGVSRRSFYEQFANKEECFLATFDLIARRYLKQIRRDYIAAGGDESARLVAVFERAAEAIANDRNATILLLLEAQTAGPAGMDRLLKATGACEHLLARGLAASSAGGAPPAPLIRAIVGGLHGLTANVLRDERDAFEPEEIVEEMRLWTECFATPHAEHMAERMTAQLALRMRSVSSACAHGQLATEEGGHDERLRLEQSVLRLIAHNSFRELTAPQIAEEANVPIDRFCDLYADKLDCLLAALDTIADELLAIAADPELVSKDWARAVRRVMSELMSYLATHPLYARAIAQDAFSTSPQAIERIIDLAYSIATLLTEGAPAPAAGVLTAECVAGAIWHTVRCQVAAGRTQLLAALPDYLSYVVLTPFIGPSAAFEIVTEPAA